MTWRFGILAALALGLAACGDTSVQNRALQVFLDEDSPQLSDGVFPRFRPLLQAGQGPAIEVTIPAADARGGFLLESRQGNIESWLGNDGVSLIFDRGVLHGTRGIGAGLLASDVSASADAILSGRSVDVERIHTFLTGNDRTDIQYFGCTITNDGQETIRLDNGATPARRMTESCRNRERGFTNVYWVDTHKGRIVRSRQWSGTYLGDINIQTVYNF